MRRWWIRVPCGVGAFLMFETTAFGIPSSLSTQLHSAAKVGIVRIVALTLAVLCALLAIGPKRLSDWKAVLHRDTQPVADPIPQERQKSRVIPTSEPTRVTIYPDAQTYYVPSGEMLPPEALTSTPHPLMNYLSNARQDGERIVEQLTREKDALRRIKQNGLSASETIEQWADGIVKNLSPYPEYQRVFAMESPGGIPGLAKATKEIASLVPFPLERIRITYKIERLSDLILLLESGDEPK
jgi:hypothetical protein